MIQRKPGPKGFLIWLAIYCGLALGVSYICAQIIPPAALTDWEARLERGATLYGLAASTSLLLSALFLPVCWFRLRAMGWRILYRLVALGPLLLAGWWGLTQIQGYSFNAPTTLYLYMGYAGLALLGLMAVWPRRSPEKTVSMTSPDEPRDD